MGEPALRCSLAIAELLVERRKVAKASRLIEGLGSRVNPTFWQI